MIATKQIDVLANGANVKSFSQTLKTHDFFPIQAGKIEIFQMNVGKLCNLQCGHCHVEAGPTRTENMTEDTFQQCLKLIKATDSVTTVDLTGGAPEMNPLLEWFIKEVTTLGKRVIIRSNLTVMRIPKYAKYLAIFKKYKVEVVASLPCYSAENTDGQRGTNVFKQSIEILQKLNELGYAKDGTGLVLNLVHNPISPSLPTEQGKLESIYKEKLRADFGISFNQLFCITNLPISRYLEYLVAEGEYQNYMELLVNSFNPSSVSSVMCKDTISIGYDGKLYDCDFNQMLELPVGPKETRSVWDFNADLLEGRDILLNNHCYGCTAGAGSSCQGSLE